MQDILLMVGPYGDWIKHTLEEHTVLVSECDGVRLISGDRHEFLSRVPDSLVDIFKIGSTAPGACLPALAPVLPSCTCCISTTLCWCLSVLTLHCIGLSLQACLASRLCRIGLLLSQYVCGAEHLAMTSCMSGDRHDASSVSCSMLSKTFRFRMQSL